MTTSMICPTKLKNLTLALVLTAILSAPVQAGVPTVDGLNLLQNIMSVAEEIAQTLKQVQEYRTQLQQYENMLQNTAAPAAYIWDQASQTMTKMRLATDTLNNYKQSLGSIDNYLNRFQDLSYYRNSNCFNAQGCSAAEQQALKNHEQFAMEAQKKANDNYIKSFDIHQQTLQQDAKELEHLQMSAQGAQGQMEAMSYGNQFASKQVDQLIKLRDVVSKQGYAVTTYMQAKADKEAQQKASDEYLLRGSFVKSSGRKW